MKRFGIAIAFAGILLCLVGTTAFAAVNDVLKVGLRYGSDALYSANLENYSGNGSGYSIGYFDEGRRFVSLGSTSYTTISMTQDGNIYVASDGTYSSTAPAGSYSVIGGYHVQLPGSYSSYSSALSAANAYNGYVAYVGTSFYARVGSYTTYSEAQSAAASYGGSVAEPSSTGITVTVTGTSRILFQFDCYGARSLGIQPQGAADPITWFKGYRYYGGFEYQRVTGGRISVINVVDVEDYVKGVVPYEMSGSWPVEALKAQAICARTYAVRTTKHLSSYGFDLCNTTDCQVYYGTGSATANSDRAVEETSGKCLTYNGSYIEAVYHSSDGGATEDAENVWGSKTGYLIGKKDPYEAMTSIPSYQYTVTYTSAQLTWILQQKGYSIGNIVNVYVSEQTNMGNVLRVTFVDSAGKSLTVARETCRTIFYSSTYNKSVRSMRFDISGGSGASSGCYVNNSSNRLDSLNGVYTISGSGTISSYGSSSAYVITSSGTSQLTSSGASSSASSSGFTITGTGNGHNVGMSQYGAKAMAEQGLGCEEILQFYYTGVSIS